MQFCKLPRNSAFDRFIWGSVKPYSYNTARLACVLAVCCAAITRPTCDWCKRPSLANRAIILGIGGEEQQTAVELSKSCEEHRWKKALCSNPLFIFKKLPYLAYVYPTANVPVVTIKPVLSHFSKNNVQPTFYLTYPYQTRTDLIS